MNKLDRQTCIRDILTQLERAEVIDLSQRLNVSSATIRTDLEALERAGFLTRYHGGAMINKSEEDAAAAATQIIPYEKSKDEIGRIAASLINDFEGVFLGPGSTCCFIAQALKKRTDITVNVVSNNFLVAAVLGNCPHIRMHFIGGRVQNLYTIPENFNQELRDIYLDKFFFSIDGIDTSAGYTLSDPAVHEVITTVARRTKLTILAADVSKFGKRSFMKIGDTDFAQAVVTTPDIPQSFLQHYLKNGIKVYTSPVSPQ